MFTEKEKPIRKYQGDRVNRKGRVRRGVSQHTVPSVPVSGDRERNQEQERSGQKKNQRANEGAKGKEQEVKVRDRATERRTESDSFRFKAGGKRGAIETAYVPAEIKAYLLRLR